MTKKTKRDRTPNLKPAKETKAAQSDLIARRIALAFIDTRGCPLPKDLPDPDEYLTATQIKSLIKANRQPYERYIGGVTERWPVVKLPGYSANVNFITPRAYWRWWDEQRQAATEYLKAHPSLPNMRDKPVGLLCFHYVPDDLWLYRAHLNEHFGPSAYNQLVFLTNFVSLAFEPRLPTDGERKYVGSRVLGAVFNSWLDDLIRFLRDRPRWQIPAETLKAFDARQAKR